MDTICAYRLHSCERLFSFGDPIEDVPILGKPLAWWQKKAVTDAGLKLIDIHSESQVAHKEYFIFDNNIFFTTEFMKKAVRLAKMHGKPCRFCTEHNRFNDRFSFPTEKERGPYRSFNFFYYTPKSNEIKPVVVPQRCFDGGLRLPRQLVKGGVYDYAQCDTYITALISPFHVMAANCAMNFYRTIRLRRLIPDWIYNRYFAEKSPNFYRALRFQNKIGKGCRIHPTAIIEGVEIGDNVIIGAHAIVRLSHIGKNCTIEDNACVLYSVLGAGTYISHSNIILGIMTYNEVFLIHGPYQFSIYGKNSAVFGTINCDFRLDQDNLRIMTDNGILDSGQPFLGIAYGHRAKVAGGNIVAPGRIVPNDYHITPPSSMVTQFPQEKNANKYLGRIDWY